MRRVVVRSVGVGGVVDDNGRNLKVIGNMPIKPGDTVWTDGHIVYGHRPVRTSVNIPRGDGGYIINGYAAAKLVTSGGAIKKLPNKAKNIDNNFNWLLMEKGGIYGADTNKTVSNDLQFYLDILVAGDNVYTAEFSTYDKPFLGLTCEPLSANSDVCFFVGNLFLSHYNEDTSVLSDDWYFGHCGATLSKLFRNVSILIKKNGVLVKEINLCDYLFARESLMIIYESYDNCIAYQFDEGYITNPTTMRDPNSSYTYRITDLNIWISYLLTQVLSFHFTDNTGAWEMVLLSETEGNCYPHETEHSQFTEDSWSSHFKIPCPVIINIVRVKSNGETEALQHITKIVPIANNGVPYASWHVCPNAKARVVAPVSEYSMPYFYMNYGEFKLETNLITARIFDKNDSMLFEFYLKGFCQLWFSNYNQEGSQAINSQICKDLRSGAEEIYQGVNNHLGIVSGDAEKGIGQVRYLSVIKYKNNGDSYFGRLTVEKTKNNKYVIVLYGCISAVIDADGAAYTIVDCPYNFNLKYMRRLSATNNIKSMEELIV